MDKNIQLTDGEVTLRRYRPSDTKHLYKAVSESIHELSPWLHWCHEGFALDDIKAWSAGYDDAWDTGKEYDFVITRKEENMPLGICGLNQFNNENRFANLGYWIKTNQTKQGLATLAALLIARFGFNELKLNRIEIVTATQNKPSQGVAERIGATKEGVLRKRLVVRSKVYDAIMYSLLPEDID